MPVCKRGDQEKPRRTRFGREKGHCFSNVNAVDLALTPPFFSVFQMSILEVEDIGESTPQGVALFLVSCESENGKEQESTRVLRMYNLASLISLAKWAISRKVRRALLIRSLTLSDHVGRPAIGSPQCRWLASTSVDIEKEQGF
jgi:hypothetical protein